MKTTIDLPDDLARKAKSYAARNHITLRAVIEQGIRQVLRNDRRGARFKLRDASVGGSGLRDEYRDVDWPRMREAAYGERRG